MSIEILPLRSITTFELLPTLALVALSLLKMCFERLKEEGVLKLALASTPKQCGTSESIKIVNRDVKTSTRI